ncbi:hypothetical protein C0W42_20790 [Photobacterium kishitanii]|uniref:DUF3693 domain-containing protein n=1 Tax=Photobacterium kishitanii TaxID=318456 RepID=UPI000D17869C|nr:DUF3693 domain-containing protein [Photobacterium kishitanii]PSU86440.1 hypothetical protein C0W42_20790 [Photobacterium kishitanii]
MFANELLDTYKTTKNYVQDKQIAADLNLSQQKICNIRSGRRQLTDNEAVFLAEESNLDVHIVLLNLAVDKADNSKVKKVWEEIAKKLKGQNYQLYSVGLTAFAFSIFPVNDVLHECALCTLC